MDRSSLTFQTFKNITYNIIGYIWPMMFTLLITPIIIHRLGVKEYGVYIFVNAVIAFLGILDFGIGLTVTRNLAHYLGSKNEQAVRILIRTGNSLFLIISLIGLICVLLLAALQYYRVGILPDSFYAYEHYTSLILLAGAIFFVNTIDTVYGAILYSLQRFDISNIIGMVSIAVSSLGTLGIVLLDGSLQEIFLLQLFISIAIAVAHFYFGKRLIPQAAFRFGWDTAEIRKSIAFSVTISLNNIANTALTYLDRLIIPLFVGPSNLTYYSIPGNVTSRIPTFSNTLSTTMFPTASQLDGSGEKGRLEILYVRSFRLITMIAAAITITAIAFSYKILFYWLSIDFAEKSAHILIILAITNFILALSGPLSSFLLGLGRLKLLTTMSVITGVLNAILLVVMLPRYGITGAAWAYLLSVLPVMYTFYYTERHYLSLTGRKRYYLKKIIATLITSAIVWTIDVGAISPFVTNLPSLIVAGALSIGFYVAIYKLFGFFEQEDWRDIKNFSKEAFRRMAVLFK